MLAVSGSVEAARAGESGRGFATSRTTSAGSRARCLPASSVPKDTVRGVLEQIAVFEKRPRADGGVSAEAEVESNGLPRAAVLGRSSRATRSPRCAAPTRGIVRGAATGSSRPPPNPQPARGRSPSASEEASAAAREAATAATEQSRGAEDLAAAIEEIASLADELKRAVCVIRPRQASMRRWSVVS